MKILIIGDIHIHDYPDYNIKPNFRLDQFKSLARRLIEISIQNSCEKLVIAGDLIHKPILTDRVANCVLDFFKILSTRFDKDDIHIIWGNHDVNSKSKEITYKDSPLVAFEKFFNYSDKKIFQFDGKSIAMMNWHPEQNLSWIGDQVDLFIGHVCISDMFGQEIDHSKFKLGLAGDIHNIVNDRNLHSINVSIPHYISDNQDGSVVVYDTQTGEFERILTESKDFKYLKIYYDDKGIEESEYVKIRSRPVPTVSTQVVHRSIDLEEVISKTISSEGLVDIHSEIVKNLSSEDDSPIDLNFIVKSLKVKNFRSIESFESTNFPSGLILVSGSNGSGKSSLLSAIDFVLNPPRSVKDLVKVGCSNLEVEIELDYAGRTHWIRRIGGSQSSVEYVVDGVPVNGVSIAEINSKINENLKFLEMFDIIYRYQNSPYLLSGYNYSQRIDLVSKLLGLGKIDRIYKLANEQRKSINNSLQNTKTQLQVVSLKLEDFNSDFSKLSEKDELKKEYDILVYEMEKIEADIRNIQSENKKIQDHNSSIEFLIRKKDRIIGILDSEFESYEEYIQLPVLKEIQEGEELQSNLSEKIKEQERVCMNLFEEILTLKNRLKSKFNEFNSIDPSSTKCTSCGREFDNAEQILEHRRSLEIEYENLKNTIQPQIEELENSEAEAKATLAELKADLKEVSEMLISMKKDHESKIERDERFKKLISDLNSEEFSQIGEMKELKDPKSLYDVKFSIQSKHSEVISQLKEIEDLEIEKEKFDRWTKEMGEYSKNIEELSDLLEKFDKYLSVFHPTGSIVKSVFFQVSEILTEKEFSVRTVKELKSGEERIDFDVDMLVDGKLLPYQSLSGGQKVLVDIFFLTKLFKMSGNVGMFILDETLRDLDINNLEKASILLKESPINSILLVTHVESFNTYDNRFNVRKENGSSIYQPEG